MNKRLELREKSLKQQPETEKGHDRSLKEASVASEFTAGAELAMLRDWFAGANYEDSGSPCNT